MARRTTTRLFAIVLNFDAVISTGKLIPSQGLQIMKFKAPIKFFQNIFIKLIEIISALPFNYDDDDGSDELEPK